MMSASSSPIFSVLIWFFVPEFEELYFPATSGLVNPREWKNFSPVEPP